MAKRSAHGKIHPLFAPKPRASGPELEQLRALTDACRATELAATRANAEHQLASVRWRECFAAILKRAGLDLNRLWDINGETGAIAERRPPPVTGGPRS